MLDEDGADSAGAAGRHTDDTDGGEDEDEEVEEDGDEVLDKVPHWDLGGTTSSRLPWEGAWRRPGHCDVVDSREPSSRQSEGANGDKGRDNLPCCSLVYTDGSAGQKDGREDGNEAHASLDGDDHTVAVETHGAVRGYDVDGHVGPPCELGTKVGDLHETSAPLAGDEAPVELC